MAGRPHDSTLGGVGLLKSSGKHIPNQHGSHPVALAPPSPVAHNPIFTGTRPMTEPTPDYGIKAQPIPAPAMAPVFYTVAGQELAQRINTREVVLLSYLGLSATLLSLSLAYPTGRLLSLAIPYLGIACAALSAHHDVNIGLLSEYMRQLSQGANVIGSHSDPAFRSLFLRARMIRELASLAFLIFTVIAAILVSRAEATKHSSGSAIVGLWWAGWFSPVFILTIAFVVFQFRHRRWPFGAITTETGEARTAPK